ncbi:MAG: Hpt domain-containing protein [Oligoflexia bacterium]|nr:Hpt domain-containing protein [Oligoflexia bacterium]
MSPIPSDVLAEIQKEYTDGFPEKIATIKAALSSNNWNALAEITHKIAGSGKTYQMPELSTLSRAIEMRLLKFQACDETAQLGAQKLIEALEARRAGRSVEVDNGLMSQIAA